MRQNNYKNLSTDLANQNVCLVAVSKTKPNEAILDLYNQGQRIFGENRVQELVSKWESLPKDIEWHAIGHLQRNKVKYIAPFVNLIHAVDSKSLLEEINKQAKKNERSISVLLQFHIATEDSKFGLVLNEAIEILTDKIQFTNIEFSGVMGMATFTNDKNQVRTEFNTLKNYFDELKEKFFSNDEKFSEISMGMSGDYKIAIDAGSTMVRIGSLLFGAR